jgi:hypothetical protein
MAAALGRLVPFRPGMTGSAHSDAPDGGAADRMAFGADQPPSARITDIAVRIRILMSSQSDQFSM